MSKSCADDVILVWREGFENVQQINGAIEHAKGPIHQLCTSAKIAIADGSAGTFEFVSGSLQQQLRRLMHDLKHQLVRMGALFWRFLQREQLIRAQVTFVVGGRSAWQDRQSHLAILRN